MQRLAVGLLCLVLCFIPTALLLGQETTGNGSVTGRVTDPSGATVPGATVSLIDESTNIPITLQSNSAGLFVFQDVVPGKYDLMVTRPGFRKSVIAGQEVVTGAALTLNVALEVGSTSETVEVKEVLGAELQTESATMGTTLGGSAILNLPTISRDVSSLVFFQPTAAPTFNGAEGNTTSGQIAGSFADQNTFLLDGGNNTSDLDGDNATYINHNGSGVMPMPAESVEEFHVNTNNMGADFSSSGGGQIMVTTKRGTKAFHGAAYDFFQGDWLNSNDWYNNFLGEAKPKAHFNRFGGALGGPLTPSFLGGKTYFYINYEGQRYPRSGPITEIVPSATLRQGIIQERDANGNIVQYNLATSTQCSGPCDPRGIGLDPTIKTLWNKYEPACNNLSAGDQLNTCGYTANLSFPLSNDFGVARIDHDFGSNWRFFSSYRYYRQDNPTTNQVDIGGLLPGDTLGQPATASTDIYQPRFLVLGLTGTLSPTLTNDFHFSYTRNQWTWLRAGALPQIPGLDGALEVGGDTSQALIPINVDTQDARPRLWDGHDYDYRDSVSKLWGTHLVQAGGEFFNQNWRFDRYDNVVGGLTQLVNTVGETETGRSFDMSAYEPVACTGTVTANCLPASELGSYNSLATDVMGLTANSSVVVTRTGANLTANPLGTPVRSNVSDRTWNVFFNDTWKIKPNFTLTYGLNYQVQLPPTEASGEQDIMVNAATNTPITAASYLASRASAAASGSVYEPTIGFSPIGDVKGLSYPYKPFWGEVSPRVAIAWTPPVSGGFLGKLFGDKATVLRGGYGRFYTRNLGIDLVSTPVLGDGFLQPVGCSNPTTAGVCTSSGTTNPATAFRVGVDGANPPVGTISQTLTSPVVPGPSSLALANAPTAELLDTLDRNFRPGSSDQVDISLQRQFKGNWVMELGYVGVWARNLYQGMELSDVPYMMKQGGQTFAQAYDNLYNEVSRGQPITAQPFFQAALPANSPYCAGFANCTAAVASQEAGNITTQSVGSMWADLDGFFPFGPSTLLDAGQCGAFCYDVTSLGYSNYNAGVASLQKRGQNVNMIANFTWSKALGIGGGLNQAYTLAGLNDPYDPGVDYGAENYDRKFTLNFLTSWNLPFGKGQRWASDHTWLNEIIGGWSISPIFSYGSGLPLAVSDGSEQEFGAGEYGDIVNDGCGAVPLSSMSYSNSMGYNVVSNGVIGVNGDVAQGGPGLNIYGSNAAAVYNNFRPPLVGIDGRCGGAGILRGQQRWNLDLGITKDTPIGEHVGIQLYAQIFNAFNHTEFNDPANVLQAPGYFGVPAGPGNPYDSLPSYQYNALALGSGGGTSSAQQYTRIIQLGVRIRF